MEKWKFVHELKDVKLVIGNGYDLYCGLKTRYSDYFFNYSEKNNIFIKWLDSFKKNASTYLSYYIDRGMEIVNYWVEFEHLSRTNIWDFFFYLVSDVSLEKDIKKWRWCDIEDVMYNSFYKSNSTLINFNIEWEKIYELISRKIEVKDCSQEECVLASIILKRNNFALFDSEDKYYNFLLDELKLFEKEFGNYIFDQRKGYYGFKNDADSSFRRNSSLLVDALCDYGNIVSVDSFNFDDMGIELFVKPFYNINGDVNAPIFGIDSKGISADDNRFIFTKTNRRMEQDMEKVEKVSFSEFQNVIVFGHSLSQNDYNYFFPLLDKIEISNFSSNKKIVFAFSVYDFDEELAIKKNIRLAIQKLFNVYAQYKGFNEPNRLLDSLTTQGKVILYEIPQLQYLDRNKKIF